MGCNCHSSACTVHTHTYSNAYAENDSISNAIAIDFLCPFRRAPRANTIGNRWHPSSSRNRCSITLPFYHFVFLALLPRCSSFLFSVTPLSSLMLILKYLKTHKIALEMHFQYSASRVSTLGSHITQSPCARTHVCCDPLPHGCLSVHWLLLLLLLSPFRTAPVIRRHWNAQEGVSASHSPTKAAAAAPPRRQCTGPCSLYLVVVVVACMACKHLECNWQSWKIPHSQMQLLHSHSKMLSTGWKWSDRRVAEDIFSPAQNQTLSTKCQQRIAF